MLAILFAVGEMYTPQKVLTVMAVSRAYILTTQVVSDLTQNCMKFNGLMVQIKVILPHGLDLITERMFCDERDKHDARKSDNHKTLYELSDQYRS